MQLDIYKEIDGKYALINVIKDEKFVLDSALSTLYSAKLLNAKMYRKFTDEYDHKTNTHTMTVHIQVPFTDNNKYKYVYRGIKI